MTQKYSCYGIAYVSTRNSDDYSLLAQGLTLREAERQIVQYQHIHGVYLVEVIDGKVTDWDPVSTIITIEGY